MPRPPQLRTAPLIPAPARRTVLKAGATLLLSVTVPLPAFAAQILAVRVWPAEDYTRVTLENDGDLKTTHFMVPDPPRLVVDIENLALNDTLKGLVAKIESNDPYIKQVRVGQNRPNVVRLVFDLKEEVKPQVFTLPPVAGYRQRLIFDLYPVNPPDPLAALIEKREWTPGEVAAGSASTPTIPAAPDAIAQMQAQMEKAGSAVPHSAPPPAHPDCCTPPKVDRMITIALDPGHGGEDPGATGAAGTHEKDIVLSIAKRLKAQLEALPNTRVMLTRDADYFVPLGVRVKKARAVDADLFVSIHADAFVERSARGSSVFVLSEGGASSSAARWLANDQNRADLIGGVNLANHDEQQLARVLFDLSTTAQIHDSLKLGSAVLREIGGINRLHRGVVEQAGFAVLKAPDIPSILVETAFISNPEEEARLRDDGYQDKIAEAITRGIHRYFAANPPMAKSRMT